MKKLPQKALIIILSLILAFSVLTITGLVGCSGCNNGDDYTEATAADPLPFFISQQTNGNMNIEWDAIEGASTYAIYHSSSRFGSLTRLIATAATNFTHTNPATGRFDNHYTVIPFDSQGRAIVNMSWNYVDYNYHITHELVGVMTSENYQDFLPRTVQTFRIYHRPNAESVFERIGITQNGVRTFSARLLDFDIRESQFRIDPMGYFENEAGVMEQRVVTSLWDNDSDLFNNNVLTDPSYTASASAIPGVTLPTVRQNRNVVVTKHTPYVISYERQMFGTNVWIFNENDDPNVINREINRVGDAMRTHLNVSQFSDDRFSFFFRPGEYQDLGRMNIGFYMHIAGLGRNPVYTELHGSIFTPSALPMNNPWGGSGHVMGNNVTHNFWRLAENFQINRPIGQGPALQWSVSQAAPIRRIMVNGTTNYHQNSGWASGGFAADMIFNGPVNGGSQQQWYTRNSHFGTHAMSGVSWNKVTVASTGIAHGHNYMTGGTDTWLSVDNVNSWLDNTPDMAWIGTELGMERMREKPFLYFNVETQGYYVFVPGWRTNPMGPSWNADYACVAGVASTARSLCVETYFFVARPGDSAAYINRQLAAGKHLLLTPGMFEAEVPIVISQPNTIMLGLGLATVFPGENNRDGGVFIYDVEGVVAAGFVLDAHFDSTYLIRIGELGAQENTGNPNNPIFVSDVFTRVGGVVWANTHAEVSVCINANFVVGDHFWIWRGDHGRGIAWCQSSPAHPVSNPRGIQNSAPFGLVVSGNRVTMHGLFVEHFNKWQTVWLGEEGRIFFYQSETPYEVPDQQSYMSHVGYRLDNGEWVQDPTSAGVYGWAAIKVSNNVNRFFATSLGLYGVFNRYAVTKQNGIEVPNRPGVMVRDAFTNEIGGAHSWAGGPATGGFPAWEGNIGQHARTLHVINNTGPMAIGAQIGSNQRVQYFHNGIARSIQQQAVGHVTGLQFPEGNWDTLFRRVHYRGSWQLKGWQNSGSAWRCLCQKCV